MKKHIAEDLPARKHPQAQMSAPSRPEGNKPSAGGDKPTSGGEKTSEEKISQAASDIRYRARREKITLQNAYSQFMQNSSMSEAEKAEVKKKLFGGGMQAENFEIDMKRSASDSMAKALYKVFVEKKNEVVDVDQLKNGLEEAVNENPESKKYKVRVTDPENKVTYYRYANREKISQLRAKGLEVEMSEHGTPYEGEKKAKKDYDGDGKIESPAKEHAGAVHNAIQRKKGLPADGKDTSSVKEDFFLDETAAQDANPDANPNLIDLPRPGTVKNKIVVNPNDSTQTKLVAHREVEGEVILETGYSKFLGMLQEKKMSKVEKKKEKKLKAKYDPSGMKASMKKQYGEKQGEKVYFATIRKQAMKEGSECDYENENENGDKMKIKDKNPDPRSIPTAMNLAKTAARFKGARNPIVMIAQA